MADFAPFHRGNTAVVQGRGGRLVFSPEFSRWLDQLRFALDTNTATSAAIALPIGSYPALYAGAQAAYCATYTEAREHPLAATYEAENGPDVSADYAAPCDQLTFAEYT